VVICIYVTFGIINLALAVALSREAIMEAVSVNLQARMRAIRVRDRERRINLRWRKAVKWRLKARRLPVWVADKSMDRWWNILCLKRKTEATWKYTPGPRRKRLNIEGLTLAQLEAAALEAGAPLVNLLPAGYSPRVVGVALDRGQEPLTYVRIGGMIAMLGRFALAMGHSSGGNSDTPAFDTDEEDQDDSEGTGGRGHGVPFTWTTTMEPDLFEATVEAEEKAAFYARLAFAFGLFLLFWMASFFFMTIALIFPAKLSSFN
jgi:potassium channel subfamily K